MDLKPGDIFCSANIAGKETFLSKGIIRVEKFWSLDNEATYGHSGVIVSDTGDTIEALWRIECQNIFKDYAGSNIIIGRHKLMTPENFERGYKAILDHKGDWYPGWRLVFFLCMPPLAKYLHFTGMPVCSEYTGEFLNAAGCDDFKSYWGLNPDIIAERIKEWDDFDIVFEGCIETCK